jgi:hypothetical protein
LPAVTPTIMTTAAYIVIPSIHPDLSPCCMIPIANAAVAANKRIYNILSSRFSHINSNSVLILGSLFVLVPYLSYLLFISIISPSRPVFKFVFKPFAIP